MIEPRHELDAMMRVGPGHEVETASDRLAALLRRPAWQKQAACRGVGTDVFWPARGGDTSAAKALCARCPVIAQCHAYAVATDASQAASGIWAGTPARQIPRPGRAPAA